MIPPGEYRTIEMSMNHETGPNCTRRLLWPQGEQLC